MSNDISTMYTKDRNMKAGRKGYIGWKAEKDTVIDVASYGDYLLQRRKHKRNGGSKKMITLDIEPYCENCPGFEAETDITCLCSPYNDEKIYKTFIRCGNRNKCKAIYDHLKEETE